MNCVNGYTKNNKISITVQVLHFNMLNIGMNGKINGTTLFGLVYIIITNIKKTLDNIYSISDYLSFPN